MRIDFDHICLALQGTPLLRDVTLSVPDRAFVSILGESSADCVFGEVRLISSASSS